MNTAKIKRDRFTEDIKDILKTHTFLSDEQITFFAIHLWYVMDYLRGYITAERGD